MGSRSDAGEKDFSTRHTGSISKKSLINKINFLNFLDREISCHLRSTSGEKDVTVLLKPLPSSGNHLVCLWPESLIRSGDLEGLRVKSLTIPEPGKTTAIFVVPDIRRMTGRGVCFRLPDTCESASESENLDDNSVLFSGVKLRLRQQDIERKGRIRSLTDELLVVDLDIPKQRGRVFRSLERVVIDFEKEGCPVFSGAFTLRPDKGQTDPKVLAFVPEFMSLSRFPPRKFRSDRQRFTPAPEAVFVHPISGRTLNMEVHDISGSGFSLRSDGGDALLFPGMVIHELSLAIAGSFGFSCSAQVVHRHKEAALKGNGSSTLHGFAFIDMALGDHLKLQSMIHRGANSRSGVCPPLEGEELWRFFFETGFIYSGKYRPLADSKSLIRETYRRIYGRSPDIARHFTYQEKGEILGHLSMLRFYTNAWLIHHHAALKKSGVKAGLAVLNQLAAFAYNSIWLKSCHMRYMFCYFQPGNPFPDFFFNGFAKRLNDRNGCSTDLLSYSIFKKTDERTTTLPDSWALGPCTDKDLAELEKAYERKGGGLMVEALDLRCSAPLPEELTGAYRQAGLKRERHLLALHNGGDLVAVIVVNLADAAINMSDLTCSATFLVIRENDLDRVVLGNVIGSISGYFPGKRFPVLMYPHDIAEKTGFPVKKTYALWILSTRYSDPYFQYLDEVNERCNAR